MPNKITEKGLKKHIGKQVRSGSWHGVIQRDTQGYYLEHAYNDDGRSENRIRIYSQDEITISGKNVVTYTVNLRGIRREQERLRKSLKNSLDRVKKTVEKLVEGVEPGNRGFLQRELNGDDYIVYDPATGDVVGRHEGYNFLVNKQK